ncbi:hypothetical protein HPB47_016492 [Ixodes persulcatus]|uniref:Uncharacterized protein n=1 Tax=Ixodes persulcatus TaxID=34615 RepID=A0AC60QT91_IXOPE|nr:hypothetical protein HPB47_016492 [Ixodes persulcatus]
MNLFMTRFIEEVKSVKAVTWEYDSTTISSNVHALCCCVDAPARAEVSNHIHFNGYFGCPWCLASGEHVGGSLRYRGTVADEERTPEGVRRDMELALQGGVSVNGVKGPSPLANLPHFNLVWGFSVDYMHGVLLGVARQFADYLFNSTNCHENFYIGTLLQRFVARAEQLYNKESCMTYNLHQLLHIQKVVEQMGPLWAHSAFVFESGNGKVVKSVTAAKGVPQQIVERVVAAQELQQLLTCVPLHEATKNLCQEMLGYKKVARCWYTDGACMLGSPTAVGTLTSDEEAALEEAGIPLPDTALEYID